MMVRRIIFACFLGLFSAQTARAETPCGTLSHMIESVSLVRQIQTDPGGPTYRAQIDRLSTVTQRISLPDLIPIDPAASRATERDALIRYVSGLREAMSGARAGHDSYARQTLGTVITPEVFGGLSSLESHWDCGGEDSARESQSNSQSNESMDSAAFSGSGGGDSEGGPNRMANPAESSAPSRNRPTTNGSGNGAYFGRDAVVGGNTMTFFIMLGVMALIGIFFYAQKRAKKKTVREARRALNVPVHVQLEGRDHEMRLVDMSMNGFKIQHTGQIDGQEEIDVAIKGIWHEGQIRWSNPHYAGVKFKRPIDQKTLASVMASQPLDEAA